MDFRTIYQLSPEQLASILEEYDRQSTGDIQSDREQLRHELIAEL